jgi:NADP-dependent 3-hydroxy acid dehydrogenase YdfG
LYPWVLRIAFLLKPTSKYRKTPLHSSFFPIVYDVARREDVAHLFAWLKEKDLSVDVFFLNAGVARVQALEP